MAPRVRVGTLAAAEVSARVRRYPRLRDAVEEASKAAGIPERVLAEHLDQSVVYTLERLGERYVTEMSAAVERVDRLHDEVNGYYRAAFGRKLKTEEMAGLRSALERLRDATFEVVPPDVWAQHQLRRHPDGPGITAQAGQAPTVTVRDPIEGVDALALDTHRPAGEPATRPDPATPRWATRRAAQRIDALPEPLRLAMRRARYLRRSLVDSALTGEPGATLTMLTELKDVLRPQELAQVTEAVGITRTPDVPYALGGGFRGSLAPDAHVQAAYHALPPAERTVLDRAAAADPEFVRAMALGEARPGRAQDTPVPWRAAEMDRLAADHGIGPAERVDLERALITLNRARETERRAVEGGLGDTPDARSRARQLDRQVASLGLPSTGQVAEALRSSALLRDFGTRNPGHLLDLAGAWLEKAARDAAANRPLVPLEVYVRDVIMNTHVRGMAGEFGAVFQLGKDVLVLKAPDIGVTVGGTDFIVLVKGTGEIWLCDNKTLSQSGLGEVSSLVESFGKNLDKDVAELTRRLEDLPSTLEGAADVVDALARLRKAADEVRPILKPVPHERIAIPEVQARVAAILDRPDIRARRVLTNAGGELSYLQQRLLDMQIDFADLGSRFAEIQARLRNPGGTPPGGGTP
jgi:hypothetical protein